MFLKGKRNSSDGHRELERVQSLRSDDYDEWESRFMLRTDNDDFGDEHRWGQKSWCKPSYIPISIILLLIILVVILPLLDAAEKQNKTAVYNVTLNKCQQSCNFTLVETIPEGMVYKNGSPVFPSTFDVWEEMIAGANHTIEIASFYWTLRDGDVKHLEPDFKYPGSDKGEKIFNDILAAGLTRKIKVRIVQSQPTPSYEDSDTEYFSRKGTAEVRNVNMPRMLGGGVLHTKLWIVDRTSAYVGSANSDWRSLSQVKEMGIFMTNCTCLIEDIGKLFDVYWDLGAKDAKIPATWPDNLSTMFNDETPLHIFLNDSKALTYISSSPKPFCPKGREVDIDSILKIIHKSDKFVYVAVMDFVPLKIYTAKPEFWPVIDNALRAAAVDHRVEIRLLISYWNHTMFYEEHPLQAIYKRNVQLKFLKSLVDISNSYKWVNITAKLFIVPSSEAQRKIPYARVNHNKYMVTDNAAYIGTSNWSGDYFNNTAGVGVIVEGDTFIRSDLESVFLRDWNSEFAHLLPL